MTKQQKLIALAKLDGFEIINERYGMLGKACLDYPNYLTNGDEIRRLIGKVLDTDLKQKFLIALKSILHIPCGAFAHEWFLIVTATPEQLAEALLKATGNWVE